MRIQFLDKDKNACSEVIQVYEVAFFNKKGISIKASGKIPIPTPINPAFLSMPGIGDIPVERLSYDLGGNLKCYRKGSSHIPQNSSASNVIQSAIDEGSYVIPLSQDVETVATISNGIVNISQFVEDESYSVCISNTKDLVKLNSLLDTIKSFNE